MKGGARKGTGPKPRPDDKMIRVSVSLTPGQYDWLKAQDASMGETVRKLIENEVERGIILAAQFDAVMKKLR